MSEGASGSPEEVAATVESAMAVLFAVQGGVQSKEYKAKVRHTDARFCVLIAYRF